jgi:hypothetical protein
MIKRQGMGGTNYERQRRRSFWMAGKLRQMDRADGKDRCTLLVHLLKDPITVYHAGLHDDARCLDLQKLELVELPGNAPKPWEIITEYGRAVAQVLMRTIKP